MTTKINYQPTIKTVSNEITNLNPLLDSHNGLPNDYLYAHVYTYNDLNDDLALEEIIEKLTRQALDIKHDYNDDLDQALGQLLGTKVPSL